MARTGLTAIAAITAVVAWFFLGGVLGVAGVLLTSHIPFAGLGMLLALLGATFHIALIVLNIRPAWWKAGFVLAIVLSSISIIGGTLAGDRLPIIFMLFFLGYYFVFGSLLFVIIQNFFVTPLLDE